jgi:hypothetical protein
LVADVSEGRDVNIFGVEGGNKRFLRNISPITSLYDVIPQKALNKNHRQRENPVLNMA